LGRSRQVDHNWGNDIPSTYTAHTHTHALSHAHAHAHTSRHTKHTHAHICSGGVDLGRSRQVDHNWGNDIPSTCAAHTQRLVQNKAGKRFTFFMCWYFESTGR
jgi:hypothetical protein